MTTSRLPPRARMQRRNSTNVIGRERHVDGAGPIVTKATLVIAATIIALLVQQVIGPIAIVMVIGLTLVLMVLHRHDLVHTLSRGAPVLAFGVLAMGSSLWSTAPEVSFRYGGQLTITLVIAVLIAGTLPLRRFPHALFYGAGIVFLLGLASGRHGMSDTGPVLIGLSGSKNSFGYVCLVTAMASYAMLIGIGGPPRWARLCALAALPLTMIGLLQGKAAAAQIQFVAGTGMFALVWWSVQVSRGTRLLLLACLLPISAGLFVAAPQLDELATYVRRDVLKKDETLTGRTELWAKADALIDERPVLGWGYRSTWLGNTPLTVGLLRWAKLPDGRGFNFHNLYREMRVDLGIPGVLLLAMLYLITTARLALAAYLSPTREGAFLLTLFTLTALVRASTEMNVAPFLFDTIFIFTMIVYAAQVPIDRDAPLAPKRTERTRPRLRSVD